MSGFMYNNYCAAWNIVCLIVEFAGKGVYSSPAAKGRNKFKGR